MRIERTFAVLCLVMASVGYCAEEEQPAKDGKPFTEEFFEEKSDLVSTGKNPFFSLDPGTVSEFADPQDKDGTTLKISVLDETKQVDGVECRIIEEREMEKGELVEISRNYFTISKRTNNVYYFGEDSKKYKGGKAVSQEGSWEAGKDGAKYGLMVPACPLIGARYYQEIAPGVAMDRAENVSSSETMKVPAGEYKNVLKTEESTPLEKDHEFKFYAPGVGLIKDGDVVLVKHTAGKKPE